MVVQGHPDPDTIQIFCSDGEEMVKVCEAVFPCLTSGHNGRCSVSTKLVGK